MQTTPQPMSVHIEATVDEVFDYFRNPANWQELAPEIVYSDIALTDDGNATTYRWATKVAGIRVTGTGTFVDVVPSERIVDRSSRSFEGTWIYSFEPEGTGTRLTMSSEPRSLWRLPPLSWLLAWSVARSHQSVLAAAKSKLDRSAPGPL